MNGGAAFPVQADYIRGDKPGTYEFLVKHQPGMTLRDYFAGQALVGLVQDDGYASPAWPGNMVADAYKIADAMLAARKEAGDE